MKSTPSKKKACVCGDEVKLTEKDTRFANVTRKCSEHGMRPVRRGGRWAKTGIIAPVRGTTPAVSTPSEKE